MHERLHALDGLRATMMLLGIVFHVAVYYIIPEVDWPKDPLNTSDLAGLIVLFIHTFRMPVFFMIAGFFSCMLLLRKGAKALLKNRLQRIGIPLVLGLILLTPIVGLAYLYSSPIALNTAAQNQAGLSELFLPGSLIHLWFLLFLLYFYLLSVFSVWVSQHISVTVRGAVNAAFRSLIEKPLMRVLVLSGVTCLTLLPMGGDIETPSALIPNLLTLKVLCFYAVFFAVGWLLYYQREVLPVFIRRAWTQVLLGSLTGCVGLAAVMVIMLSRPDAEGSSLFSVLTWLKSLFTAFTAWLMLFGLMGLFLRYFDKPSARMRYIVDASYWVYLIHLPFVFIFPGMLKDLDLSALIKMPVTMLATTVVCFLTYNGFVRSTFIGLILNGRRYDRGLPVVSKVVAR